MSQRQWLDKKDRESERAREKPIGRRDREIASMTGK